MPNLIWNESWSPPMSIDDVLLRLQKREGRVHLIEAVRVLRENGPLEEGAVRTFTYTLAFAVCESLSYEAAEERSRRRAFA